MEREQFTFYKSFYLAMRRITDKAVRADIYDCLCQYAIFQQVPDLDSMAPEATLMFEMAKPVLDVARVKSIGGKSGTSKEQESNKTRTRVKQDPSKEKEKEVEKEKEIEKENEIEHECEAAFDLFWEQYPRKVKKQQAREAFQRVSVSLDVLLQALSRQKETSQWQEDGGRFVPYPAAWLQGRRWEDEISQQGTVIPKGCGPMKRSEFNDISKLMGDG